MLKQLAPVCVLGIVQELAWLACVGLGPLREHVWPFLALMAGAFVVCLWGYLRASLEAPRTTILMLAFALLFRLTVLPAPPYQSEDVYRYLWDARVSSA
jgi:FtsH-binding integral membrane protein